MKKYFSYNKPYYNFNTGEYLNPVKTQNYKIIQIADHLYSNAWEVENHLQMCDVELTFISSGKAEISTDDNFLKCGQGENYISFKGEKHCLKSNFTCRFLTLALDVNENSPCKKLLCKLKEVYPNKKSRKAFLPDAERTILATFSELERAEKSRSEIDIIALDGAITQTLTLILRQEEKLLNSGNENLVREMISFIDEHYLNLYSLKEVATYLGYSYGFTEKLFKETFSNTLKEYLTDKKMKYALTKLKSGNCTVSEVAEEMKYSSLYNFSRAFKNYYGYPPTSAKK